LPVRGGALLADHRVKINIKSGWLITTTVIVVLGALVVYGFLGQVRSEGKTAPGFSLTLFGGNTISLKEQRGQVVVINFWASWCVPCREEAADLEQTWRHYQGKGVSFVGINVSDTDRNALAFIKQFDITYPNGPDRLGRIAKAYGITGQPETYVVAPDGRLVARRLGPLSQEQLQALIEQYLAR
jgi:cytochrome c biogenesis protein CcmG, thiol:disulfide interchange protein DsbE